MRHYQRPLRLAQACCKTQSWIYEEKMLTAALAKNGSANICRTTTPDQIPLEAKDVTNLLATLTSEAPCAAMRYARNAMASMTPGMTKTHSTP